MDPTPVLPPPQQDAVDRWKDKHCPDALAGRSFVMTECERGHLGVGTAQHETSPRERKRHYAAKLSDDEVREIRRCAKAGESMVALAAEFGVTKSTVYKIKQRVIHARIKDEPTHADVSSSDSFNNKEDNVRSLPADSLEKYMAINMKRNAS